MTTGRESYLRHHEPWTNRWVADNHVEALHIAGEPVIFTMMWIPQDHEAGLVDRCPLCYVGDRAAAAFNQAPAEKCPGCFGTTFEGGYRAQIIRPALVDDRSEETEERSRGVMIHDSLVVETVGTFSLRKGDYLFRFDNKRYQCEEKGEDVLRTGFSRPMSPLSFSGNITSAHLEDPTAVAYVIPPVGLPAISTVLDQVNSVHLVPDFEAYDLIRPGGYL